MWKGLCLLHWHKKVQEVQQLYKVKENVLKESLDDEEERDFDLMEDDELEWAYIHHGIEIVDLEAQDEERTKP